MARRDDDDLALNITTPLLKPETLDTAHVPLSLDLCTFTLAYGRVLINDRNRWIPVFFSLTVDTLGCHFNIYESVWDGNPSVWLKQSPTRVFDYNKILLARHPNSPDAPSSSCGGCFCFGSKYPSSWMMGETEDTEVERRRCCVFVEDGTVLHIVCRTEQEAFMLNLIGAKVRGLKSTADLAEKTQVLEAMLDAFTKLTEDLIPARSGFSYHSLDRTVLAFVEPTKLTYNDRQVYSVRGSFASYFYFDDKEQWVMGTGTTVSCCGSKTFKPAFKPAMVVNQKCDHPLEFTTVGYNPHNVREYEAENLHTKAKNTNFTISFDATAYRFSPGQEENIPNHLHLQATPVMSQPKPQTEVTTTFQQPQQDIDCTAGDCCTCLFTCLAYSIFGSCIACYEDCKGGSTPSFDISPLASPDFYDFVLHDNVTVKLTELLMRASYLCQDPLLARFMCVSPKPGQPTPLQALVDKLSWRKPPMAEPITARILAVLLEVAEHVAFEKGVTEEEKKAVTVLAKHKLRSKVLHHYKGHKDGEVKSAVDEIHKHLSQQILPAMVALLHRVAVRGEEWGTDSIRFTGIPASDTYPRHLGHGFFNRQDQNTNGRPSYYNCLTKRTLYWSNSRKQWEVTTAKGDTDQVEAFSKTNCMAPEAATSWHFYIMPDSHTRGFKEMRRVRVEQPGSGLRTQYLDALVVTVTKLLEAVDLHALEGSPMIKQLAELLQYAVARVRIGENASFEQGTILHMCSLLCSMSAKDPGVYDVMFACVKEKFFDGFVQGFHHTSSTTIATLPRGSATRANSPSTYPCISFFHTIFAARNLLYELVFRLRCNADIPRNYRGAIGSRNSAMVLAHMEQGLQRLDRLVGDHVAYRMYSLFLDSFGKLWEVLQQGAADVRTSAEAEQLAIAEQQAERGEQLPEYSAVEASDSSSNNKGHGITTEELNAVMDIFSSSKAQGPWVLQLSKDITELTKSLESMVILAKKLPYAVPELMLIVEQAVTNLGTKETTAFHHSTAERVIDLLANMTEHAVVRDRLDAALFRDVQLVSSVIFQADPIPVLVTLMRGRKQKKNAFRTTAQLSTQLSWFTNTLRALGNLAKSKKEHRLRIVREGLIPVLLRFLIVGNLRLRHNATRCLNETLQFTTESVEVFLQEQGHLTVLRLAREATNAAITSVDSKLEGTLFSVLSAVASVPQGAAALLDEGDFLELLLSTVEEQAALYNGGRGLHGATATMCDKINLLFIVMTELELPSNLGEVQTRVASLYRLLTSGKNDAFLNKLNTVKAKLTKGSRAQPALASSGTEVREDDPEQRPEHESERDTLQAGELRDADGTLLSKTEVYVYQLAALAFQCKKSEEAAASAPPSEGYIFLSYSWKNKQRMLKIAAALQASKFRVWRDENEMHKGANMLTSMGDGIAKASAIVVDYSIHHAKSHNCRAELGYAFKLHKPMFFVKTSKAGPPEGSSLDFVQGSHLYLDYSRVPVTQHAHTLNTKLCNAISHRLNASASDEGMVEKPEFDDALEAFLAKAGVSNHISLSALHDHGVHSYTLLHDLTRTELLHMGVLMRDVVAILKAQGGFNQSAEVKMMKDKQRQQQALEASSAPVRPARTPSTTSASASASMARPARAASSSSMSSSSPSKSQEAAMYHTLDRAQPPPPYASKRNSKDRPLPAPPTDAYEAPPVFDGTSGSGFSGNPAFDEPRTRRQTQFSRDSFGFSQADDLEEVDSDGVIDLDEA